MFLATNRFAQLADLVRAGHTHVRAQMQRELEPCMLRAVNRVLTPGAPASPLHRWVAGITRQMHVTPAADSQERLRLAQAICQRIVNQIGTTDTLVHDVAHTLVA